MKKFFIALCLLGAGTIANLQAQNTTAATPNKAQDQNGPRFQFKGGETYDFGEVAAGPDAEHKFEFVNVGKQPLVIIGATASCSCTVPDWPKQPILPGKTGVIKVSFKTEGKSGPFNKDVYIQSNAVSDKPRYELHIKGNVKAKA